ncbi:MAG: hypothetical protein H0U10_10590 [Chloroflexia bacterium]|nr:hypothetical protein [Chloroflexia bacterium]
MAITVVSNLAVLVALLLLVSRVFRPGARPTPSRVIHREPLSLLGRLRLSGVPGGLLLIATVLGWWSGLVSPVSFGLVGFGLAALLALPVAYTLTPRGIALGRTPPRRWTEFGGVGRQQWGVRLQGVAGGRGMTVWLSGDRGDDDFVLLLRKLVRGSYQGWVDPAAADATQPAMFADGMQRGAVGA